MHLGRQLVSGTIPGDSGLIGLHTFAKSKQAVKTNPRKIWPMIRLLFHVDLYLCSEILTLLNLKAQKRRLIVEECLYFVALLSVWTNCMESRSVIQKKSKFWILYIWYFWENKNLALVVNKEVKWLFRDIHWTLKHCLLQYWCRSTCLCVCFLSHQVGQSCVHYLLYTVWNYEYRTGYVLCRLYSYTHTFSTLSWMHFRMSKFASLVNFLNFWNTSI